MQISFYATLSKISPHKKTGESHKDRHRDPLSLVHQNELADTFIRMAKIDTASYPMDKLPAEVKKHPTTHKQTTLAKILVQELKSIPGVQDVQIDRNSVVTATVESNLGLRSKYNPTIGLLAHIDTNYDAPTENITPVIHKKYAGGDIHLPKDATVIWEKDLKEFKGEDIITSDGSTLLGADDKSGIAIILETLKIYNRHPELKHPKLRIAFTPDEENASYIKKFDIKNFGADFAYTLDGGSFYKLGINSFGSDKGEIIFEGIDTHPGYAKGIAINALDMAAEFIKKVPQEEKPETTEGFEGYYNLRELEGNRGKVKLVMSAVGFQEEEINSRVQLIKQWAKEVEEKYPGSSVKVNINPFMYNMYSRLRNQPEVIENAKIGIKKTIQDIDSEKEYVEPPTRGGTDGTSLTIKGLLTPNLPSGQHNIHTKKEFVSTQEMARCTLNVINVLSAWSDYIDDRNKTES